MSPYLQATNVAVNGSLKTLLPGAVKGDSLLKSSSKKAPAISACVSGKVAFSKLAC